MAVAPELIAAQQFLRQQRVQEAWAALSPLLTREPGNVQAYLLAGRIQLALDQNTAARGYLAHAVGLAPGLHGAQFLLGFCLYLDNDFTPALAALEAARKLKPDDGPTLLYLALTYEGLANNDAALKLYPRAVENNPSPEAPLAFARLLFTLGLFTEAQARIKESLRRNPEYREAWYEQARLHMEAGHNTEAVDCATRALGFPGLPQTERQIHFLLARAYGKLGNAAAAAKHRQAFEAIPPRLVR